MELNESSRRSTESAEILGVKDIASINNALVFSLMHLFLRSRFSGNRDQYIKENTEVIRNATSLITMDECLDLYWWVNLECVLGCVWVHAHAESGQ